MTSSFPQYVGLAAPTTLSQVSALQEILSQVGWPADVRFMNGPMVSRKTLSGFPASNPAQYLPIDQIDQLMLPDARFFNVVHFNSDCPQLDQQLCEIIRLIPGTDGIQLNIAWPDPQMLIRFQQRHPEVQLVLQVSRRYLEDVEDDLVMLVRLLQIYEGVVDYVLYDPSGGEGIPFDTAQARVILQTFVDSGLQFGWGVTGGLCADRVRILTELLEIYPQLSWDAQSGLRTQDGEDALDLNCCFGFLAASAALLRSSS